MAVCCPFFAKLCNLVSVPHYVKVVICFELFWWLFEAAGRRNSNLVGGRERRKSKNEGNGGRNSALGDVKRGCRAHVLHRAHHLLFAGYEQPSTPPPKKKQLV